MTYMSCTISLKPLKLRRTCQEKGGDLASLATNKQIDSIWPFVPEDNTMTMSGNQRRHTGGYWIGGVKKNVVGSKPTRKHWLWLTGKPLLHIQAPFGGPWIHGPECAAYYKLKGHSEASITDDKCDEKHSGYICQFTPIYCNLF